MSRGLALSRIWLLTMPSRSANEEVRVTDEKVAPEFSRFVRLGQQQLKPLEQRIHHLGAIDFDQCWTTNALDDDKPCDGGASLTLDVLHGR